MPLLSVVYRARKRAGCSKAAVSRAKTCRNPASRGCRIHPRSAAQEDMKGQSSFSSRTGICRDIERGQRILAVNSKDHHQGRTNRCRASPPAPPRARKQQNKKKSDRGETADKEKRTRPNVGQRAVVGQPRRRAGHDVGHGVNSRGFFGPGIVDWSWW